MKKRIYKLMLAGIFLGALTFNFIIRQGSVDQDITLLMKNIEALADGEGSIDCPKTCFDSQCEATIDFVNCVVMCGTKSCTFKNAIKKN